MRFFKDFNIKAKYNFTNYSSFHLNAIDKGHHNVIYRGVPMIKSPFDYVLYQMIISEVKPDLIIEIGTKNGGSAYYFADLLDMIGGNRSVHTIDIVDKTIDIVKKHPRISFFLEGFMGYDINNTEGYNNILVIDDGSHKYQDVKNAISKFKDIVSLNSYFIVEDGIVDALGRSSEFNGGPNKAILEFVKENNHFIIDRKWCDFFGINATFNTNGFLRKIAL